MLEGSPSEDMTVSSASIALLPAGVELRFSWWIDVGWCMIREIAVLPGRMPLKRFNCLNQMNDPYKEINIGPVRRET